MGFWKKIKKKLFFWKKERVIRKPVVDVVEDDFIPSDDLDTGGWKINLAAVELIKEFEGFYSKPYLCPANVPTIGFGSTYYPDGRRVKLTDAPLTKKEADNLLAFEVNEKADKVASVCRKYNLTLNKNELGALTSFAFNLGTGYLSTSKTMGRSLQSGDRKRIADSFLIYTKARAGAFGRLIELKGLVRRRKAERQLFLS